MKYSHPFICTLCETHAPEEFSHFAPTDSWIISFPEKHLIHVHFGTSTTNDDESDAETRWAMESSIDGYCKQYPTKKFFTLVDVSRADDSELPSENSVQMYKEMMANPQNGIATFYGATPSMRFFLKMIRHLSKAGERIQLAESLEDADEQYKTWFAAGDITVKE